MSKKSFVRGMALLAGLGIILSMVPALNSAEKRPVAFNIRDLLKSPVLLAASIFPAMNPLISESGSKIAVGTAPSKMPKGGVRPTDEAVAGKPGTGN